MLSWSLISEFDERQKSAVSRYLVLDDQAEGISINRKLRELRQGEVIVNPEAKPGDKEKREFVPGDISFTTPEKALLLRLIARPWGAEDAEYAAELKEKLS